VSGYLTGGAASRARRRVGGAADRFAPAGGLRRAVAVLAGGNVVAVTTVALGYPIVSRLYTPAEFGQFAAAIALLSLVLTVTCLTYDRAVPLPEDDRTAGDLVILCLLATLVISALSAAIMLTAGERLLEVFDATGLSQYWWLLFVAQLAGGVTLALTGWAIRFRGFRQLATSRISQSIVTVSVQVAAGAAGAATSGLLAGDALGRTTQSARLSGAAAAKLVRAVSGTSIARLRWAARRYRRFPLLGSWPSLINAIGFEAPLLLVVAFYGAHTGGLFAFAQRLIGAPVALLVLAVSQVFVAEAADRVRTGSADLGALFRRTLRQLVLVVVPLMLALAIAAELLVGTVFGQEWHEAGTYVLILAPLYTMQLVSSPFTGTLDVLERQDLLLIREAARISLLAAAIGIAELLSLPAVWAIVLLSGAGTLAYLFYGAISWHALIVYQRARELHVSA
jgi:O-antigen/teichoic acid export membrane protein